MKNYKKFAVAMALSLSLGLVACGNPAEEKAATTPTESIEEVETPAEETTDEDTAETSNVEAVEETEEEVAAETEAPAEEAATESVFGLGIGYLPENFIENYRDEKKDLHTVEYVAEKNPAAKIQLQVSDNEERFAELVTVPEDAEEITIDGEAAKYWEDGSFKLIVMSKGANHIYARSTLDRDETIKVVEELR